MQKLSLFASVFPGGRPSFLASIVPCTSVLAGRLMCHLPTSFCPNTGQNFAIVCLTLLDLTSISLQTLGTQLQSVYMYITIMQSVG